MKEWTPHSSRHRGREQDDERGDDDR